MIGLLAAAFALATMPAASFAAGSRQDTAKSAKAKKCKRGQLSRNGKCVTKEVHLPPRSCEGVLPGYSNDFGEALEKVIGKSSGAETSSGRGYSMSTCAFEEKKGGHLAKRGNGDEVFNGVLAALLLVETWSTERAAQGEFKLKSVAVAGKLEHATKVPTNHTGAEAYLWAQSPTTNSYGEQECGSLDGARVHNIEVIYSLEGVGPEAGEACGAWALALLKDVAAGLSK